MHSITPEFVDKGMSVYYYLFPNALTVISMMPRVLGTRKWMDTTIQPLLEKMGSMPGLSSETMTYMSYQFNDFYTSFHEIIVKRNPNPIQLKKRHGPEHEVKMTQSQGRGVGDSWLLAREHMQSPELASALQQAMPKMKNGHYQGIIVGGPGVSQRGKDTSVLPAWRRAYGHVITLGSGTPDISPLRKLAPDMGAYANEAWSNSTGWRTDYWGSNYKRLSSIKQKYDPEHVLWVTPGINADAWSIQNGKLCRTVPKPGVSANETMDRWPTGDNPNFVDISDPAVDDGQTPSIPSCASC